MSTKCLHYLEIDSYGFTHGNWTVKYSPTHTHMSTHRHTHRHTHTCNHTQLTETTIQVAHKITIITLKSRLTVVSREAKEEVPCDGLSTNACEYLQEQTLLK